MQIFELHFNPKKENHTFNTFISEPQNAIERKMGSLYMAGEVTSPLLKPEEFLGKTANIIKKSFYSPTYRQAGQGLSPEKSLSNSLKIANDFLGQEVKKENVGWLGNFNFAVLSMKDYNLVFTKTGNIRIILIRGRQISDIGKNLNLEGIDPYPVKIFFNVAAGRLVQGDILLVLSNNIFEFIKERGILNTLANSQDVDAKKIKELLPHSLFTKGEGSKISGLSLIFLFNKEKAGSPLSTLLAKAEIPIIIRPLQNTLGKVKKVLPQRKISLPKIKNPFVALRGPALESFKKVSNLKKKIILVAGFVVLLLAGFLIFKTAEDKKEKDITTAFSQIEQKVKQAESFLLIQNEKEADKLLKQAFKEIIPLTEKNTSLMPSILSLQQTIQKNLEKLNKLEKIENPEIAFEVADFAPEKITVSAENIYLYNNSNFIQKINIKTGEKETIEIPENVKYLDSSSRAVLIYAEPNKIYYLKNGVWEKRELLVPVAYKFNFDLFSSYLFNLYFIDSKTCNITKYSYLTDFEWGSPKLWHEDFNKTCSDPVSASIDGSIWLLNKDNTVTRYYTGEFQENISFDIFPFPKQFKEINIRDNLYILEPENNRIVVAEKNGKIIKQFQSKQFNNLKSFALSENNKTIYLLNDSVIYKIEI